MSFAEDLPPMCPPNDAIDVAHEEIYRLIPAEPTESTQFLSYAALGDPCPPHIDPCRWASCSLVYNPQITKRLPKFKNYTLAAKLTVPIGAGLSKKTNGNHVDFWCGSSPTMLEMVTEVVSI